MILRDMVYDMHLVLCMVLPGRTIPNRLPDVLQAYSFVAITSEENAST